MSTESGPERQRLISLAYRLLGSLAEAEDAVQEAYTRWYALSPADRDAIESPEAWLTTVTSRICLDVLRSARVRRESYVGEWLPEPLPSSGVPEAADPADRVTLDESVSMAFMVVLETMSPAERVAFILHDVFRYPFAEVAAITGRTPAACRQLASSARRRVQDSRNPPAARQAALVSDFRRALEAGNVRALIDLLDPGATITSDGGGLVPAAPRPVTGAEPIARFLAGLPASARTVVLERTVNGQPGLVAMEDGVAVTVFAFAVAGERITRIWAMRNPEKLQTWNPLPALAEYRKRASEHICLCSLSLTAAGICERAGRVKGRAAPAERHRRCP